MKIGIVSDTHNETHNTRTALDALRAREITTVIHCGDITTPDIVYLFGGFKVTFVFGNQDTHWLDLGEAANAIGADRPTQRREIEIAGKQIGITHGVRVNELQSMIMSGKFDYVCHGHTHHRRNEYRSAYGVRVINPGALGGYQPEPRSICILDVASGEVEFVSFPEL